MTSLERTPWIHSIRTKILLPSAILFTLFTAILIIGTTRVYTDAMDKRLVEKLETSAKFMDATLREEESRATLHVRFMADMLRLAERVSGDRAGRSSLVYLLDYLREAGIHIHTYPAVGPYEGPLGRLIRKGALGIHATDLFREQDGDAAYLVIASVAPIVRAEGIREVIVGTYPLTDDPLAELKKKLGVDVTLFREGNVMGSTLTDTGCRQALRDVANAGIEPRILEHDESVMRDLQCSGIPQRALLRAIRIGHRNRAICALSVPTGDWITARKRMTRNTLLAAGLIFVSALIIHSLLIRRITRPIQDLARVIRRVAARDFGARVPVTTRDEIGALEGSYNLMIDRLAKSETEIEQLHQKELERADRLATIGELASGIAHEVRNPLAGISGAMQVLRQDDRLDDERKGIVDEILAQIDRMKKLTSDLLDYSKPATPRLQPANLSDIMERAILFAVMGNDESRVRIEKDYDPDLPEVSVDAEQVQQAFLNILLNAIQALPEGGTIRVGMSLATEDGQERAVVEIHDDGPGMTRATLDKAVRPFFTTKHQGTGLGLSIARQIMHHHSGTIDLDSEPGKGTRITMTFPVGTIAVPGKQP